jgi:hypothetical protein
MPSGWALAAIAVAFLVSLTGALDVRARLPSDQARRRFKYALIAAAVVVAVLQLVLQGRSTRRLAQLEVGTRTRSFTEEQRNAAALALAPRAGQRYWLIVQTTDRASEQARFTEQIDGVLAAAGWVKSMNVMRRESATAPFQERPMPMYDRGAAETGVVIFGPADDMGAAAELKQQLEPVAARLELASDENLKGSVVIQVGPR